jgi:hypothetical protein
MPEYATSTFDTFLVALREGLRARPNLAGVQISAAPLGGETDARETVWFDDIDLSQTWGMIGSLRRDEAFTLNGTIWVTRPGKNEDDADTVRARARYILAEIETFLRVAVLTDRTFKGAEFERALISQGFNDAGRVCRIDFAIAVGETLPRTD